MSGSLTKTQMKESEIRPEYNPMSYELRALAKIVQGELGSWSSNFAEFENYSVNGGNNYRNHVGSQTLFERGRLYEQYSARRNERLRKKQDDPRPVCNPGLGVKVESGKKKSVMISSSSGDITQHHRYALRSVAKRPPLPLPINVEEKMARKTNASRSRRI